MEGENDMTMGLGVVLVVIGAILTYALHITVSWVDLQTASDTSSWWPE